MAKTVTVTEADDGQRLDRWLKTKFPAVPYTFIQKALRKGEIKVDSKRVEGNVKLTAGQAVRLPPLLIHASDPDAKQTLSPHDKKLIKDMLIYEDDAIIVFNKPSGIATQGGTKTHKHMDYYLEAFADKNGDKPKLVHRLDKETSGVLVVAKSRAVAERMGEIFKWREAKKTYLAITVDTPRDHEADIRLKLVKAGDKVIVDREEGKDAHTYYKTLTFSGRDVALLALRPTTGRMHQLRVHLAHIKCPILGDKKYGGMAEESYMEDAARERMWLHAVSLSFPHPVTGKFLSFSAQVPHAMHKHLEEWHLDVEGLTDKRNPEDPLKNYNENYVDRIKKS